MIYRFDIADERKDAFLQVLEDTGIDYELVEKDRAVVRIFGVVDQGVKTRLDSLLSSAGRITLRKAAEIDCYGDFHQKSHSTVIAGPCAVESEEQIAEIVGFLSRLGILYLRGGAYKPRTSAESFQGMGLPGLKLLRRYASQNKMFVVTEVMDKSQIETVAEYADILQVGSRNMYNYTLLTALGSLNKPILLKRGMSATVEEWLASADYISRGGNDAIILCERGIRTFEPKVAHTLDLAAIVLAKKESGYPVIADASHASGRSDLVAPLAAAAIAAGADGIMVEIHPDPAHALSDGKQALAFEEFERLVRQIKRVHSACVNE